MTWMIRRVSPMLTVLAMLLCGSLLQGQSLADAARRSQNPRKTAAKVYTNDNLPTTGTISVIGTETPPASQESRSAVSEAAVSPVKEAPAATTSSSSEVEAAGKPGAGTEPASADAPAPAQRNDELRRDAAKLKEEIAMLEREIDLLNREFRLRAATFYADAGNSLRNPKQWAEQQREHESKTKEKQAALDAAKQKFSDLQEQGRRAGVAVE